MSNCYMVAGTTGLVHVDPPQLKNCIRDNGDGTVTVRLFENQAVQRQNAAEQEPAQGELEEDMGGFEMVDEDEIERYELRPVYVKVTKEIPRIAGMDALSAGALWMQMIEFVRDFRTVSFTDLKKYNNQ